MTPDLDVSLMRADRRAGFERDALSMVRSYGHVGFISLEPDVEGLRAYRNPGRFGIVGP